MIHAKYTAGCWINGLSLLAGSINNKNKVGAVDSSSNDSSGSDYEYRIYQKRLIET